MTWSVGADAERASLASARALVTKRREQLAAAEAALAVLESARALRAVRLPSGAVVHASGVCGPTCAHELPDGDEIDIARAWIRKHARPRATVNRSTGSYFLKHRAEEEAGTYVTNGAFIAAAALEGYLVVPSGRGPSAYFNMGFARGAFR